MIEVAVATLIVALLAAAIFTGFGAVSQIEGAQRHESAAIELAQQDEQRLRGLSVAELIASGPADAASPSPAGNESYYETIDGEPYLISSNASFVSARTGGLSCSTSGSASADYIATTSTVTWADGNDGRKPVVAHSLVAPTSGGVIVASVQDDASGAPYGEVPGATVEIQGPGAGGATQTLNTDANGCAVDAGLAAGSYTVTATAPAGYVLAGSASQSVMLANGGSETAAFFAARPSTVQASFNTVVNGVSVPVGFDSFSLSQNGVATTYGTPGTYAAPVSSGATVYPAPSGSRPTDYAAYAGTCTADAPASASNETAVAAGESVTVPITITLPSILLSLSTSHSATTSAEVDDAPSAAVIYSGSHWTHGATGNQNYDSTESFDLTAGDYVKFTFTGTSVEWVAPVSNNGGYANVYLDGTLVASNVTTYSATTAYQQVIWSDTGLANSSHTLELYVDGTKPAASTNTYVQVDAFIYGSQGTSTTTPVSSATLPFSVTTYDSCPAPVNRTLQSAPTATTVSGSTVYPVAAPYGTSVQVCFANTLAGITTNTGALPSGASQISNTNYAGTTITSLTLPTATGATGASAVFDDSGGCPS